MFKILNILFALICCAAMYAGGGFAEVASWYMILCGISGIAVGTVYRDNSESSSELRKRLVKRNGVSYAIGETMALYAVYLMIQYGWLISAFIYVIGSIMELTAYLSIKTKEMDNHVQK